MGTNVYNKDDDCKVNINRTYALDDLALDDLALRLGSDFSDLAVATERGSCAEAAARAATKNRTAVFIL